MRKETLHTKRRDNVNVSNMGLLSKRFCERRFDNMSRSTHHVVPNPDGGWDVKRGGAIKASRHTDTKSEAVDIARVISRNQNTELVIHRRDGKIQNTDSHGNDPCPPRDRR